MSKRKGNKKIIERREDIILPLCKGREVLDVGCAGYSADFEKPGELHERIASVAWKVIGVDCDEKNIKRLRSRGYNVVLGNAENIHLEKKFDVIVAGEVIEHVNNQGLFLENMRRHLRDDGVLVISTPNAYYATFCTKGLFGLKVKMSPGHIIWHNGETLAELAKRFGFKIKNLYYVRHVDKPKSLKGRIFLNLCRMLLPPRVNALILVAILKKKI